MKKLLTILILTVTININGQVELKQTPIDYLPKGFSVFDKLYGDLNKDGIEDCVLIIKGTDKNQFITDYRGELDRNRRGIIVMINNKQGYELVVNNYDCFYSENEDGGVYHAPILNVEIKNENLYIHFHHGRYGSWGYTFRFKNSDLELIGYDAVYPSNITSNWANFDDISVNFLSQKKLTKEVIKVNEENGEETFKETWEDIIVNRHIKLSEIKTFEELTMSSVYNTK